MTSPDKPRHAHRIGFGLLLVSPYAPLAFGWTPGFDLFGMIVVTAAAVGAPGFAAVVAAGRRSIPESFAGFVFGSWFLCFLALALRKLLGLPLTAQAFALVLGALTCAVGVWGAARRGVPSPKRAHLAVAATAALGFALSFFSAKSIVPPLQDQDMDGQNTAYGLAAELTPFGLTDRSTLYFFAHPLLLHHFNACTLLLSGEIEVVRPPYDAAVLERDELPPELGRPGFARILRALRLDERPPDRSRRWMRDVYGKYLANPALFGTRAPNVAFNAAFAALLFLTLGMLGLSRVDAGLVTIVSVSLPEIVVRSGYGGYFAPTALTFLIAARVAGDPLAGKAARAAAGFLAMFTSQKAVTVGAAVFGSHAFARLRDLRRGIGNSFALLAGMAAAVLASTVFGLVIAPEDFVLDGLLEHGVWRFSSAAGKVGAPALTYPGVVGLWKDFASQMGWAWSALALVAFFAAFRRMRDLGENESDNVVRIAVFWLVAGAVVFTATDWRQTKHLCTMLPAIVILVGSCMSRATPIWKRGIRVVLLGSIAWNAIRIARLAQDFNSFPVRPIW